MMSRAFFRRPSVRELVPDLKLVLTVLTIGCESHAGVYLPAGLGEDCGLDPSSLAGALADLDRRGHILTDKKTGEVFIVGFYRDNVFKSAQRVAQWQADFNQIESEALRRAVLEAIKLSPDCGISVDNSAKVHKKQPANSLGVGVAIKKEEASSSAAAFGNPAAESQNPAPRSLNARLDELRANGANTRDPKLEKDRADIQAVRDIAYWAGDEAVLNAISVATYPSQARKACKDAGLEVRAAKARAEHTNRDGDTKNIKMMNDWGADVIKQIQQGDPAARAGRDYLARVSKKEAA